MKASPKKKKSYERESPLYPNVTCHEILEMLSAQSLVIDSKIVCDDSVKKLVANSRECSPSVGFIAYQGVSSDLHTFIASAAEKTPPLIIIENRSYLEDLPKAQSWIQVTDARKAWSFASALVQGNPENHLNFTAFTGTNGKSSCVYMTAEIMRAKGLPVMSAGTLGFDLNGIKIDSAHTTPDPDKLYEVLRRALDQGITHVVMEVSSHAIAQNKIAPIQFDTYCFTSFSRDHLDFHKSMTEYLKTKLSPLWHNLKKGAEFYISESVIKSIETLCPDAFKSLPKNLRRAFVFSNIDQGSKQKHSFTSLLPETYYLLNLNSKEELTISMNKGTKENILHFKTPYIGTYANENLAMSLRACARALRCELKELTKITRGLSQIPGRLEVVSTKPVVIVDYAHTPDALEKLLRVTSIHFHARIHLVFGCGGDRDKGKRPHMGHIASQNADFIYVTSDNPRHEDPHEIIKDIMADIPQNEFYSNDGRPRIFCILERNQAIQRAIQGAIKGAAEQAITNSKKPTDIVVIAGKGHETYQIIGDLMEEFDDRDVSLKTLKTLGYV